MNKTNEIRCPCCGEIITSENDSLQNKDSDEKEIAKILNDLNIEFG